MSLRGDFRALARAALAADPRMGEVAQLSAWAGNIPAEMLPVLGVVTPQERATLDVFDQMERSTLLQVVVKRLGGDDLEDTLDEDAEAIEDCVVTAIFAAHHRCLPEDLTIALNGEGEQRVGTAIVNFRVTWHRPLGGED
jgi:hypothetical protein